MLVRERPPRYGAYLLRYWEVRSDCLGRPSTWQFSLEEAGTGERRAFRDLAALVAFLEQELEREDVARQATGWGSRGRLATKSKRGRHAEEKGDP